MKIHASIQTVHDAQTRKVPYADHQSVALFWLFSEPCFKDLKYIIWQLIFGRIETWVPAFVIFRSMSRLVNQDFSSEAKPFVTTPDFLCFKGATSCQSRLSDFELENEMVVLLTPGTFVLVPW